MTAQHFARQCGVSVIFREDATPSANTGTNTITFPSNLASQSQATALVWLLHESAHLRWSEPVDLGAQVFLHPFLNTLEDVRVDHKVFADYPAVKDALYRVHVAEVLSDPERWRRGDSITEILVATVIKGLGFEDLLPKSGAGGAFMSSHTSDLDRLLSAARFAANIQEVLPLAEELAILVMGKEAVEQLTRAVSTCEVVRSALDKLKEATKLADDTRRSVQRRIRYRRKKMAHLSGPEQKQRRDCLRKQAADLVRMLRAVDRTRRDLAARIRAAQGVLEAAEETLDGADGQAIVRAVRAPGLFSLDESALEFVPSVPFGPLFERVLMERLLEPVRHLQAGSARILPKRLHAVYAQPERALGARRPAAVRWKKLFFLLDASGSMEGYKADLVRETMAHLANSLEQCKKATGAQVRLKYEIWVFSETADRIKGPEDPFNEHTLDAYQTGGGTDLRQALDQVRSAISRGGACTPRQNVLFCLTDAEFQDEDVKAANSFRAGQVIYVGIGAQADADMGPEASAVHQRLFLKHNVLSEEMLESVLQQAILDRLSK
jgi:uncharacterized protein YegL